MATAPRQGRKGGKLTSSPSLPPRAVTPGSIVSPSSFLMGMEGTTVISDPNAAHPFDPDPPQAQEASKKKSTTAASETNVLQFDLGAIQEIGKGVMVGRSKQVRTITRQSLANTSEVVSNLETVLAQPQEKVEFPLEKILDALVHHHVVVTHRPPVALAVAVALVGAQKDSKVLVVVPRYFEVTPVKTYLDSMMTKGTYATVGELCGQTFNGSETTRLWVASAETALLYLTKLREMAPFTHVVVPGPSIATQLVSCFVKLFTRWMLSKIQGIPSVRLIISPERFDRNETERAFEGLKMSVIASEEEEVTQFTYSETCALAGKEIMEMETDRSGKYPPPTKRLVEHTSQIAAEVVRCIVKCSKVPQSIVIFTGEVRDILTALQGAHIEDCAVYSGFKSTEETADTKHRVHVMNHVRYDLGIDNTYTAVIDMGIIRRTTSQHRSESFMAASVTEWETKVERSERLAFLGGKKSHCFFSLCPDNIVATFVESNPSFVEESTAEEVFTQCARLNLSMGEAVGLLPAIINDTVDQVMQTLAERCTIANAQNLAITFIGEIAARLPVELDITSFVVNGCAIGLGEASLAIASVMALPFRSTTPLTYTWTKWSERTAQSREKYGGDVFRHSDILADTLVFLEWLKLRARGESTTVFVEEILVQEFKLQKIEGLMKYMREQLSDYVFLEPLSTLSSLEAVTRSVKDNATAFLLLESIALARRAAFIRDAGHLNEKDRFATMAFVRTSKHLISHSFIPSSLKWTTGRVVVPVTLTNSVGNILAGLFSLIHTPYFFASLLLLYPKVEYSKPVVTDKGQVVYFGVTCNRQMKRVMVSVEEAVQILEFRERWNLALGCMQALRTLHRPITITKYALTLKEHDRSFDLEKMQKELRRQLVDLVTELSVVEYQGTFETYKIHCIVPKELLPMTDAPASDAAMLQRFADETLWEKRPTPQSLLLHSTASRSNNTPATPAVPHAKVCDDEDDDVEVIQQSYFMLHGPLVEDDDDDDA